MGRLVQMAECIDCKNDYGSIGQDYPDTKTVRGGFNQPPKFFVVFEWKTKQELIEYIEDTSCPVCDSDNWRMTDWSEI